MNKEKYYSNTCKFKADFSPARVFLYNFKRISIATRKTKTQFENNFTNVTM